MIRSNINSFVPAQSDAGQLDMSTYDLVDRAFKGGLASVQSFDGNRKYELEFVAKAIRTLRDLHVDVSDPKATIDALDDLRASMSRWPKSRTMFAHLLFPDVVEAIPLQRDREAIIRHYAGKSMLEPHNRSWEIHQQLAEIRNNLSNNGDDPTFSFFREDIVAEWRSPEIVVPEEQPVVSKYWWINQGEMFQAESDGGYIWAPLIDKAGRTQPHWSTLAQIQPGDVTFHYAGGLRAVGLVKEAARESRRPNNDAEELGRVVALDVHQLANRIILNDLPHEWRQAEGGPFNSQGGVKQGYAFPLSSSFVTRFVDRFPEAGWPEYLKPLIPAALDLSLPQILSRVRESGLRIGDRTLRRYHTALRTRGFVILSGPSGTGKTWLAQKYADAVGAKHLVVSVAPNWTSNEDLIGYLSPLTKAYVGTDFSLFLREASSEFERNGSLARPHHLVLDEMNLARVEYYFATFLSKMEIKMRDGFAEIALGDDRVKLAHNLAIIGTVNIDETTHGFADKVYDRAQLIELAINRDDVAAHLEGRDYAEALLAAWDCVREYRPFAFRTLDEIDSYVTTTVDLSHSWQEALDEQLLHKVLPRLTGTDPSLDTALERLKTWSADEFPLTYAKVGEMQRRKNITGVSTFFE